VVYKVCLRTAGRKVSVALVACLWTKRVVYRSGIASGEYAGCHMCVTESHRVNAQPVTGVCHRTKELRKTYIGHSGCRHILSVE